MQNKKLSCLAGLALISALAVVASAVELKNGHPDKYVVQKGDTLWDIAGRFLKSPWQWPEIWQANPQVENPHRIYPGDVLSLIYLDGKPVLVAESDSGPRVRVTELEDAIEPLRLADIRPFIDDTRILSLEERKRAPYVVANEEDRILGGERERVAYVRQAGELKLGQRIQFARAGMVYHEVPAKYPWTTKHRKRTAQEFEHTFRISNRDVFRFFWRDWIYEHYSELLGYEYVQFATGEVVALGDPATVRIIGAHHEVRAGDILVPVDPRPFDFAFYPQAPKELPEGGRVLAMTDTLYGAGPKQVVVLNRGTRDGVRNGDVYGVYEPGNYRRDEVRHSKDDAFDWFKLKRWTHVQLPPEFTANVMVFKSFETVSYALVMEGTRPVRVGSHLQMPME